jgi:hypothetical protein
LFQEKCELKIVQFLDTNKVGMIFLEQFGDGMFSVSPPIGTVFSPSKTYIKREERKKHLVYVQNPPALLVVWSSFARGEKTTALKSEYRNSARSEASALNKFKYQMTECSKQIFSRDRVAYECFGY